VRLVANSSRLLLLATPPAIVLGRIVARRRRGPRACSGILFRERAGTRAGRGWVRSEGVTLDDRMNERARRLRTRISAALVVVGSLGFSAALVLPAADYAVSSYHTQHVNVDDWDFAMQLAPFSAFLAGAVLVWGATHWFRWAGGRYLGLGAAFTSLAVELIAGPWSRVAEDAEFLGGYWTSLAATGLICAAFLVMPKPDRADRDDPLPRDEVERARERLAWMIGLAAAVVLLPGHLLLSTSKEWRTTYLDESWGRSIAVQEMAPPKPPPGVILDWIGPTRAAPILPDIDLSRSLIAKSLGAFPDSAVEGAWLALPFLFLIAARKHRSAWRIAGAASAATFGLISFVWLAMPWERSKSGLDPLDVVWHGPPLALVAAFLLLPPTRRHVAAAQT
jgi:hypothetical protein